MAAKGRLGNGDAQGPAEAAARSPVIATGHPGQAALGLGEWLPLREMLPVIAFATLLSAVAAALGIFVIAEIGRAISVPNGLAMRFGLWSMAGFLVLLLVLNSGARYILSTLAQDATLRIRRDLVERIMRASLRRVEDIGAPRIYSALTVDAFQVSHAMASIPIALFSALLLSCGISYIGFLSWKLLLFILGVVAVGVSISVVIQRRAARILNDERQTQDSLMEAYEALAYGKKEFMLSERRRSRFLMVELSNVLETIRRVVVRSDLHWEVSGLWSETFLMFLLVVMVSLPQTTFGLDHAVLAQILLVTFYLRGPVGSLINIAQRFAYARVALKSLRALVLDDDSRDAGDRPQPLDSTIELRGVQFSYRDEESKPVFTVGPIDLVLKRGEVTFITGGNGSGKSTLCKLICGLYAPEAGQILIDGEPATSAHALRDNFSALFFDYFPFPTLPLGTKQMTPERRAVLDSLVADFQLSGRTELRGNRWSQTRLSTGQRRRLALISTLAEDKNIYLFDEPAADQDPHFRHFLYTEVIPALKRANKAVVVVSHDESFFATADHLYALIDGRFHRSIDEMGGPMPAAAKAWQLPPELALSPAESVEDEPETALAVPEPRELAWRAPGWRGWLLSGLACALVIAMSMRPPAPTTAAFGNDSSFDAQRALRRLDTWMGAAVPHPTGSSANAALAKNLAGLMRSAGFTVDEQNATNCDAHGCVTAHNIVASRLPHPDRPALLISAHYDSAPTSPGAADNGLAVTAVVEFAQSAWLRGHANANLVILLSDAEELGAKGAELFLRNHPLASKVRFVINLDSIGSTGPLVAYDFGTDPSAAFAGLLDGSPGLAFSGAINALYELMPNTTDLAAFAHANIPGVSLGYVLGDREYHYSGDRVERLTAAQVERYGAVLRHGVIRIDERGSDGHVSSLVLGRFPGVDMHMPKWLAWLAVLLGLTACGAAVRHWSKAQWLGLAGASLWLASAIAASVAMAMLLGALGQTVHWNAAIQRLSWPLLLPVAAFGLAVMVRPGAYVRPASSVVLIAAGAVLLVYAPGLAPTFILAGLAMAVAFWWKPHLGVLGAVLAFAIAFPLLHDALMLVGGMSNLPYSAVGIGLWVPLWLPWIALVAAPGEGARAQRLAAVAYAVVAVALQWQALRPLEPARQETLDLDLVELRNEGHAFQVVRTGSVATAALENAGYLRQLRQLFPWGEASPQWMQAVPCCGSSQSIAATEATGNGLRVLLAPHSGVQSFTFAIPIEAGLRRIWLDDGQSIDAVGLIKAGRYRLFLLRDGLDRHRSVRFEFAAAYVPSGLFLAIERPLEPQTANLLRDSIGEVVSSHVPDRHLIIEPIGPVATRLPAKELLHD